MATILTETGKSEVDVLPGDGLWMTGAHALRATGWQIKPEGFCKDDVCVPTPAGREQEFTGEATVNIAAFWALMGKPAVQSEASDVWFFGESAHARNDALLSLEAPDFSLPDFSGKLHSLTDFRRKRILLATWASW